MKQRAEIKSNSLANSYTRSNREKCIITITMLVKHQNLLLIFAATILIMSTVQGVPKKPLRFFRKDWMVFSKTVLISKINCISTSFKKKKIIIISKKVTGPVILAKLLDIKATDRKKVLN